MKLTKMCLENFMKYENAEFDFSDVTKISGRNGAGKSSIATAYMWCLFDCDYNLKSNPAVRRVVDGVPVVGDVSVTLDFIDVDGKETTARKVQKRSEKDGNVKDTNKYFVNDVPKTKKEFEERLGINATFKTCSNIDSFLNEKSDYMRSYLFSIAKGKIDLEIAKASDDLSELAGLLEKYTTTELSAMNRKKETDIEKELLLIDGQIEEVSRNIRLKSDIDISDLELERNSLKERIAENRKKQENNSELLKEYENATSGIMELKFKLSDIQNKANNANAQKAAELRKKISNAESEKSDVLNRISKIREDIKIVNASLARNVTSRNKQAELWKTENAMVFDENSITCPHCGQEYPEEKKEQMRSEFNAKKSSEMQLIEDRGKRLKELIESDKKELDKLTSSLDDELKTHKKLEEEISEMREQERKIPVVVDVSGTEEYKEIQSQIEEKEKYLAQFGSMETLRSTLKQEEYDLTDQLKACEQTIDQSDTSSEEKRLEELENQKKDLGQQKTDARRILYLLKELEALKNDQLSDEINQHFGIVQWKLFDYAKNGSYKSVCIPMVDGKSILTTMSNKGNRILGKMDICRSIRKIEGISVPIWLDDCESLDAENQKKVMDMVDGQLIMLIVNNEEKLKVEKMG